MSGDAGARSTAGFVPSERKLKFRSETGCCFARPVCLDRPAKIERAKARMFFCCRLSPAFARS